MSEKTQLIKVVFFDADDTLINHKECEKQALVHVFRGIGVDYQDEYQSVFRPLDRALWDHGRHDRRVIPREDIPVYRFQCLFGQIGMPYHDCVKANELFKEGLANSSALQNNAEKTVRSLHEKGFSLCIVTNGLVSLQKPRIVNSAIGGFITRIIVSEETGAAKPDPRIFRILLDDLGITPSEAVMVGDSLEKDIQGAKNAGIRSIWYNPARQKNRTGISPDDEIHDLPEIENILVKGFSH